ncbi:unnamed protein product [Gongylonema pulchrum]|uniref:Uncharacterized protein n=1 Tax=Gongylonema pulchrum TaxID=637853 RepID=A0A3P7PFN4_9BILA|nr:unnamed protein product [Gongylonema pulchrum]
MCPAQCNSLSASLTHARGWPFVNRCVQSTSLFKVVISDSPPVLDKSITVYYKHQIGPYNHLSVVRCEARKLLPDSGAAFAIFFDDPEELKENLLQSAVGVVFGGKFRDFFSMFTLLNFTYPKVNAFLKEKKLPVRVTVEIFSEKLVHLMIPLDHQEDFVVPQLMTIEELESKLARKKWDSDQESESTSESGMDEEQQNVTDGTSENDTVPYAESKKDE